MKYQYDGDTQLSLNLWERSILASPFKADKLSIPDAEVIFYSGCFSQKESDEIFQQLLSEVDWRQDIIKCYGKDVNLPRLTAWYGDSGRYYTYSNIVMEPLLWTSTLLHIKKRIEEIAQFSFNSVLLNLYRDGKDSIAWHSDDEPELGKDPVIASLSFGGERKFQFKHRFKRELGKIEFNLTNGSLLIMKGETQQYWQHQVPKTSKPVMPRINLTFRAIK